MAVRMAATWRVHPGRQEDFVKLASDWKPIGERFKMNNQQLLQVAAGNAEMPFNTVIYTAEFAKGTDYGAWLDPRQNDPARLTALLRSAPSERLTFAPVSPRVNDVHFDDPDCLSQSGTQPSLFG